MDSFLPMDVLARWIHVGTAIVVLGGSVFLRVVLMPAASASLTEADHDALRQRLMATWRRVVTWGIALFLLSGFYNYLAVALPRHRGDGLYHGLMGIKILLAFVVFFLASALVGRSEALAGIRRKARQWLAITILLGFVIVGISGFLKVARPGAIAEEPAAASEVAPPEG
ncbi:hypothetical protein [Tautonia rosea]|uniref:hypothetical protein n=1 Tax=Tautonia rosea TaxID=2728037 RepID=UPI0014762319|nr:hypothetical protein [Tautonia rosea]